MVIMANLNSKSQGQATSRLPELVAAVPWHEVAGVWDRWFAAVWALVDSWHLGYN